MHYRALVIDDEEAARRKLRQLLSGFDVIDVVGEANNGKDAIKQIRESRPDVVFMDMQMHEVSGLQVAVATEDSRYALVFVTAHDQYAIAAFEANVVDYLLKPVRRERLAKTVQRLAEDRPYLSAESLEQIARAIPDAQSASRLAIRRGTAVVIVDSSDIAFIEMVAGYCRIHLTLAGQRTHGLDTLLSDTSLASLHESLPQDGFIRLHRSTVVNSDQVASYTRVKRRHYVQILDFDDIHLPVSRAKVAEVKQRWPAR